jgi:anti-sigma-K factor RskA
MNTSIPDELLTAYVDGELEGTERERVEQAIAHDARLAQRVAQHRALRGRLRNTFDATLREPVPQRLVNASRLDAPVGPAQIIDLARVRAERARRPERRRIPIPRRAVAAVAASVIVGLAAGLLVEHAITGAPLTEYRDGALLASGSLNHALNDALASTAPASGAVRIGLSFRAKSGSYCRTFLLEGNRGLAGLACRQQQRWRILTVLGTDSPGAPGSAPGYRMAGSAMPAALLQAVNEHISGEPLDAAAEAKAQRNGWH